MGGNNVVPTLDVMIRPELRGGTDRSTNLVRGFDQILMDYLEGRTGITLQEKVKRQNKAGYGLQVSSYPNGDPMLTIDHLNPPGIVRRVRNFIDHMAADSSLHSLALDLNVLRPESRQGLLSSLYYLVSTRNLGALILVNTDDGMVNAGNERSFERCCPFRLVERHVGQGHAFPSLVGDMIFTQGMMRLP